MTNTGKFVISLDFELIWGIFDHFDIQNTAYFDNTINAVPKYLDLFEKFGIHATWATVGMLFNHNKEEWTANIPDILPCYENEKLDAYAYGKKNIKTDNERFFFAPHLIAEINAAPHQEIGTHTYSHYYCLENTQDIEAFRADLHMAKKLAEEKNILLQSLVFPRNQFNKGFLSVCKEIGLKTVRNNPNYWYWDTLKKENIAKKIFRSADAYLNLGRKSYTHSSIENLTGVLCQPASRFLRPVSSVSTLNKMRNQRILMEMEYAAKNGYIYHLWWHPHNFGNSPDLAFKLLIEILNKYQELRKSYNMQSLSMREVIIG